MRGQLKIRILQSLDMPRRALMKLLAPRSACCALCGGEAAGDACLCADCAPSLPPAPMFPPEISGIDGVAAPFVYEEPVRSLIHRFKYANARYVARFAAVKMAGALKALPVPDSAALVAVPLHPRRRRHRTFSQSDELVYELHAITRRPVLSGAIRRLRDTPHQTGLSAAARRVNLVDAFKADPSVAGKAVILVDDVVTTGSTLLECAKALRAAGAASVYALVLAAGE